MHLHIRKVREYLVLPAVSYLKSKNGSYHVLLCLTVVWWCVCIRCDISYVKNMAKVWRQWRN